MRERLWIINTFFKNLVLERLPDCHLRNFQRQHYLTNSVYFHLGRHMDALIHEAMCSVFFTWADVVGQEAEELWVDFMNMTSSFAKSGAMLCWWIISHLKPKTMISMWHWIFANIWCFKRGVREYLPVSQVRGIPQKWQTTLEAVEITYIGNYNSLCLHSYIQTKYNSRLLNYCHYSKVADLQVPMQPFISSFVCTFGFHTTNTFPV